MKLFKKDDLVECIRSKQIGRVTDGVMRMGKLEVFFFNTPRPVDVMPEEIRHLSGHPAIKGGDEE